MIDLLFHNKLSAAVGYLLYLGFLPLVCYIPFVYGTLPGFAASLVALYYLLLFMQGKKWKWIAYSSVFISFAYLCKTNYVITFIAFVCILFAGEIIEKKKGQYVLAIAALTGCLVFTAFVSNACMESLTGKEVSKGVSTWGRVAMGLQESYRAPGWFNDYVYVNYREAGRDTEAAAENAKVRVKERLLEFSQHPGYFLDFFSKKLLHSGIIRLSRAFGINR